MGVGLYQYKSVYTEQQTEDAVNEEQVIKSQGQRSLVGYSPEGLKESDTTEVTSTHTYTHP